MMGDRRYQIICLNALSNASNRRGLPRTMPGGSQGRHSSGVALMKMTGTLPRRRWISSTAAGPVPSIKRTSEVMRSGRFSTAKATASACVTAISNDVAPSSSRTSWIVIARNGSSSIIST
ncbi:hypothetical protein WR25_20990 [Diploscapter pachys]|uniref:Uncharacterized protein n=1 Tax=Diploscapter pachys TaxID=2018661 RepID=A0A2A2K3Q8_9BILA|nr:hypothetical protein WR25_20990 [Diploscapter pachys]